MPSFSAEDMQEKGREWADPVTAAPKGMRYVLFPIQTRGATNQGSILIYQPPSYATSGKRYPVIYFLHGGMGNQRSVELLLPSYIAAMQAGKMPECLIVSVQALPIGWYANARVGAPSVTSGPVEDVIVHDLIPFVDANYRTIPDRNARGLEGWSMGGFGALRLAFKFNDLFAHASSFSGALIEFDDEPIMAFIENTFGPVDDPASRAAFDEIKPLTEARRQLKNIAGRVDVRIYVGDQDWLFDKAGKKISEQFSQALLTLGIQNEYVVIPGVGHELPMAIQAGKLVYPAEFWNMAFSAYR